MFCASFFISYYEKSYMYAVIQKGGTGKVATTFNIGTVLTSINGKKRLLVDYYS